MKQHKIYFVLFFVFIARTITYAQVPSDEEILRLVIAQKKATDAKDAPPFNLAPGGKAKAYPGHYTSRYNVECIVVCPLTQGREYIQFVLLLYKTNAGFWENGCWYHDNAYRLKVKDLNKDAIQELIVETKISSGTRVFGNYKIISLLNQLPLIWYENNTFLGTEPGTLKDAVAGKEITRDVKVSFEEVSPDLPALLKERTTSGLFNSYSDSTGVKLDYETKNKEFKFIPYRYVPKIN